MEPNTAVTEFWNAVKAEQQAANCDRQTAVARVARRAPGLHCRFLKATNRPAAHQTIDEAFGAA